MGQGLRVTSEVHGGEVLEVEPTRRPVRRRHVRFVHLHEIDQQVERLLSIPRTQELSDRSHDLRAGVHRADRLMRRGPGELKKSVERSGSGLLPRGRQSLDSREKKLFESGHLNPLENEAGQPGRQAGIELFIPASGSHFRRDEPIGGEGGSRASAFRPDLPKEWIGRDLGGARGHVKMREPRIRAGEQTDMRGGCPARARYRIRKLNPFRGELPKEGHGAAVLKAGEPLRMSERVQDDNHEILRHGIVRGA